MPPVSHSPSDLQLLAEWLSSSTSGGYQPGIILHYLCLYISQEVSLVHTWYTIYTSTLAGLPHQVCTVHIHPHVNIHDFVHPTYI